MRRTVALALALAIVAVSAPALAYFDDTVGSVHAADIAAIADAGVTKGCNPPHNTRYCPERPVTRGEMAAFLVRSLGLSGAGEQFSDTDDSQFAQEIGLLAAAGITKGCNPPHNTRFCPDDPVTRGQMAAFLVRAHADRWTQRGRDFVDDDDSVFEADIERLAAAGITKGCNPPDNTRFCPDDPVTREQMASFLRRMLALPVSQFVQPPELEGNFLNPERGFHELVGLEDDADMSWVREGTDPGNTADRFGPASTARVRIDLSDYRDRDIDTAKLDSIREGLDTARRAGIKVIVRPMYNSGSAEDASPSQMLRHIDQLGPVYREYADVIAVFQAGFIGRWGEWHGTPNAEDLDVKRQVIDALIEEIPADRHLSLRYPSDMMLLAPNPVGSGEAWSGKAVARVGFTNDCFLVNEHDSGTFVDRHNQGLTSQEIRDYTAAITRYGVAGGETCAPQDPAELRYDCWSEVIPSLERYHFSYLNTDYYRDAYDTWASRGCLDDVEERLGYRFSLRGATLPLTAGAGGDLTARMVIDNEGFAPPYNPRPVELRLRGQTTGTDVSLDTGKDARSWQPGRHTVDLTVRLPDDLPADDYVVWLRLPDPSDRLRGDSRFAIRLANQDIWNAGLGANRLATVEIR